MKQDYLLLMMLVVLAVLIARSGWGDMLSRAVNDSENGQALFAPLVAGYLFWLRRSRLQFIRYRPNLIGPVTIAIGILCSWWGTERDVLVVWHAGGVIMLLGCVLTMTGIEVVRQFLPVIICMFFIIPTPGAIRMALAAPLQDFATGVTMSILDLGNVLAVRDGNVILIGEKLYPVAVGKRTRHRAGLRAAAGGLRIRVQHAVQARYKTVPAAVQSPDRSGLQRVQTGHHQPCLFLLHT